MVYNAFINDTFFPFRISIFRGRSPRSKSEEKWRIERRREKGKRFRFSNGLRGSQKPSQTRTITRTIARSDNYTETYKKSWPFRFRVPREKTRFRSLFRFVPPVCTDYSLSPSLLSIVVFPPVRRVSSRREFFFRAEFSNLGNNDRLYFLISGN